MEPHTGGQTQEPLDNDVQGLPVFLEELDVDAEIAALDRMTGEQLLAEAGIEPIATTSEAAEYFDRTAQWIYWGLNPDPVTREIRFVWSDGSPIVPNRVANRRRFTMPILRAILKACYRRGNITDDELKVIIRRIRCTELGVEWREREGWKYAYLGRNRYRWVKPKKAYYSSKIKGWKVRKETK